MASLEYVVRPFGAPNAQGQTLIPSINKNATERATLIWGAESTLPPPKYGGVSLKCCQQKTNELSREGETVRINGSDGESWIDVFRANKLKVNHKNDQQSCLEAPWETSMGVEQAFDNFSAAVDAAAPFGSTNPQDDCDDEWTLNNNTGPAGG